MSWRSFWCGVFASWAVDAAAGGRWWVALFDLCLLVLNWQTRTRTEPKRIVAAHETDAVWAIANGLLRMDEDEVADITVTKRDGQEATFSVWRHQ